MKKLTFIPALAMTAVLGCSQKVTEVPFLDKVMTASEFSAQDALRKRVLLFCADDPGRYRTDPNCVNAQQSVRLTSSGTGNFPRVQPPLPAWAANQKKAE